MNPIIKSILPHLAAVLIFFAAVFVYFMPQFQGQVVRQTDIVQFKGMAKETQDYYYQTGIRSFWTNSMFAGMPTYQINSVTAGNQLRTADKVMRLGIPHPAGRFLAAMIGFYILMTILGANFWLSIIGAVAFGFTTNNLILYDTGHVSKLNVISYFPFIIAGMVKAYRGKYFWGALLFALGVGLNIFSNHIQMTYYLFITLLIYGIAQLIHDYRAGVMPQFLKGTLALMIGGLLAFGSGAANLFVTYQYSKDTIRGAPILQAQSNAGGGEASGLGWDYAMGWSNGMLDNFASFIPGIVGAGSQEKLGKGSPLYSDPTWRRYLNSTDGYAPYFYWGSLPFTSGPIYFGAVICFLFIFGIPLVKGPIKWWLVLGTLLTFLFATGKNIAWFNHLFFDYFPFFNKFRTPNSVLSVTAFMVPILGFMALNNIIREKVTKAEAMRSLKIAAGITGAVSLFFVIMGPSMFDMNAPTDGQVAQIGLDPSLLPAARAAHMRSDALRVFILIALSAGLMWAFIQDKIKEVVLIAGLGALIVFDLWSIGQRYMNRSSFEPKFSYDDSFSPRPADQAILQDTDPHYRVFDLSVDPFKSSTASYYHKNLGGYHAAKLRRYQDIIERQLQPTIQRMSQVLSGENASIEALNTFLGGQASLNMLNTKYLILNPESQPIRNRFALGNAWFVDNIQQVNTPDEEINALNTIDPSATAVVHQEFSNYVSGLNPQKAGSIQLTEYTPNGLTYSSSAPSEQMAVFSEVWYGPNKGWQAYIDGNPVDHIRANYVLRAMKVPAGDHTIEFRFEPTIYNLGKTISIISSSLILLFLVGFGGWNIYQFVQNPPEEPVAEPQPKTVRKRKVPPTRKGKRKPKK